MRSYVILCVCPKTDPLIVALPARLGRLLTEDIDFSLRRLPLAAGRILLPNMMSLSKSSCTMLSSVAMPFASTQTGTADNALAAPIRQARRDHRLQQ